MDYQTQYQEWLSSDFIDEKTKQELRLIQKDEKEIEDRFYRTLEFGTGGLRGVIGAGTNRMNEYTVMRATQGLANYISQQGEEAMDRGVAIAHDSRRCSPEFAEVTARVFAANGIKAYLYPQLEPTPVLSFTVRELNCIAGIVITASHNPKEYNGYKAYWEDGGQLVPEPAEKVIQEVDAVEGLEAVKVISKEEGVNTGMIEIICDDVLVNYVDRVCSLSIDPDIKEKAKAIKIVYTPIHGSGKEPVVRVLNQIGYPNVVVVPEQSEPDSEFSTVSSPNPENSEAFELAIEQSKAIDADVIVGTDPDADRVGVVVKDSEGNYKVLDGNQTGALLTDYILRAAKQTNTIPDDGVLIKTIVTSELGAEIARSYGLEVIDTLTGFKFIGEKMLEFEQSKEKSFVFGYEESYGYLAGDFVRDKDAVIATMLICEMTAYYKAEGKNLYQALQAIWEKYGAYKESQTAITMKGKTGMEKIASIMTSFRESPIESIDDVAVTNIEDYSTSIAKDVITGKEIPINLRKSNVLKYWFKDGSWLAIRPSGTEPKIKFYFSTQGETIEEATAKNETMTKAALAFIEE